MIIISLYCNFPLQLHRIVAHTSGCPVKDLQFDSRERHKSFWGCNRGHPL